MPPDSKSSQDKIKDASSSELVTQHEVVEKLLDSEGPDWVRELPPERRAALVRVVEEVAVYSSFQGPIPPPTIIGGYERVLPGTGQLIINEFIIEGTHRRDIEQKLATHSITVSRLAQIFAFILGLVGLVGGIVLCATGNNVGGLGLAGTSLVALVTAFLRSQSQGREERKSETPAPKAKQTTTPKLPNSPKNKKRR